jgi:hypothetical protein
LNEGDIAMDIQEIHKEILGLCADDNTGLWFIISSINQNAYAFVKLPDWVRFKP